MAVHENTAVTSQIPLLCNKHGSVGKMSYCEVLSEHEKHSLKCRTGRGNVHLYTFTITLGNEVRKWVQSNDNMHEPGSSSVREKQKSDLSPKFQNGCESQPSAPRCPHCLLFQEQLLCGVGRLQMNRLSLPPALPPRPPRCWKMVLFAVSVTRVSNCWLDCYGGNCHCPHLKSFTLLW